MKTDRIALRLPPRLKQQIEAAAAREGNDVTVSFWIRRAIERALKERK